MDRTERGGRGRDEPAERGGRERGGRDEPRGGRDRDEPRGGGRERGGERGSERGAARGGYEYQRRSQESVKNRATQTARNFDSYFKDGVKVYKTNEGDNTIRPLPPTWKPADHYGFDIWVHGYLGADNQSYLCPKKMLDKECPVCEELARAKRDDSGSKDDEKYIKSLEPKKRVVIYLIDRDNEKEGVQIWAMPWTVDRDICKVSQVDRSSGETLFIDDPENGYDVDFERKGTKDRTEYIGIAIARRESPLGNGKWLDYAEDNPIPDQLVYYDYDHLAKALGGGGSSDRDEPRGGRDRDEPRGGGRERARDESSARSSSRGDPGGGGGRGRASLDEQQDEALKRGTERGMSRDRQPTHTWASIHAMTFDQMCALVDAENIRIDPDKSKDDADLADWICEEMKLKDELPAERGRERGRDEARGTKDEPDPRDRLASMRQERSR